MNKEEYEKLQIIKTVEGNEIVEKYYNPITCTMVSKVDIDCYKYKQALLDIKELLEKDKKLSMFNDCREPEEEWSYILECDANPYLDIVNKALGDKENRGE